ncbi:MAG: hypothetical protein K2N03_04875, partial [Muribaculaceae bacterium]|nr:hypothetical protein [Muribaculaceae bacterium]
IIKRCLRDNIVKNRYRSHRNLFMKNKSWHKISLVNIIRRALIKGAEIKGAEINGAEINKVFQNWI